MDDVLLQRIGSVANYYRGARWGLSYDSVDGGEWSMSIISASDQVSPDEIDPLEQVMAHLTASRKGSPVFAMRCSSLEVITVALEHWHAASLAKEL